MSVIKFSGGNVLDKGVYTGLSIYHPPPCMTCFYFASCPFGIIQTMLWYLCSTDFHVIFTLVPFYSDKCDFLLFWVFSFGEKCSISAWAAFNKLPFNLCVTTPWINWVNQKTERIAGYELFSGGWEQFCIYWSLKDKCLLTMYLFWNWLVTDLGFPLVLFLFL